MRLVFFFASLLLFTSCYNYKEVSVLGIQDFQILKLNKEGIQTDISVKIKNPNKFGFNIYSGSANISLSKISLGKAKLVKKVYIPAESTGTYHLILNTSFDKITMQDVINSIGFSGLPKLKIDGHIKVGKFLIRKKIPVNYEGSPLNGINFGIGK